MKFLIPSVWIFIVPDSGHLSAGPFASPVCSVILKAFQFWETTWQWISKGLATDQTSEVRSPMWVLRCFSSALLSDQLWTPLSYPVLTGCKSVGLSVPFTLLWYSVWEQGTLFLTWTDSEFILHEADTPFWDNELGGSECVQMQG